MEEKKNKKAIIAIISVVAVLIVIGITIFFMANAQKLKLYNSTLELGQENCIEELLKEENVYIKDGYTYSVKDNSIDINNVGTYEITFEIKGKGKTSEETKKVKVQDTTPPTIELKKDTFFVGDNINIEEIISIKDFSQEGEIPYNEADVKIEGQFDTSKEGQSQTTKSVQDKNGNKGTQDIKINVKNPVVNLYDYINEKLQSGSSRYSNGSYDNKFAVKYDYNFGNGISSQGWVNFTEKVHYSYSKLKTSFSTITTADFTYFNDKGKANKVYTSSGLTTGNLAVDKYLKAPSNFERVKGDLSTYQTSLDSELSSINELLGNKSGKINLIGKTVEELKKETIDLRELQ